MTRTNDQRRSKTRIVILCGRGKSLSAHRRQDNNPSLPTVSQNLSDATGDRTPQREISQPGRGDKAPGRSGLTSIWQTVGRLSGYRWQTVGRPVTDDSGMTDPETGHLTDSGPATDQNRTPCRQASMSPCQQGVINPFENPVGRVSSSVEDTVHWNGSESTGSR
jgi:hypothetical protein